MTIEVQVDQEDQEMVKKQWHYKLLNFLSSRSLVFVVIPLLVLCGYVAVFGMGELAVHTLATAQYTMMAFVAYIISGSLSNRAESSKALSRAYDNSNPGGQLSAAIVFGVIIFSRIITFVGIAMAYTIFMTNSRAVV